MNVTLCDGCERRLEKTTGYLTVTVEPHGRVGHDYVHCCNYKCLIAWANRQPA